MCRGVQKNVLVIGNNNEVSFLITEIIVLCGIYFRIIYSLIDFLLLECRGKKTIYNNMDRQGLILRRILKNSNMI